MKSEILIVCLSILSCTGNSNKILQPKTNDFKEITSKSKGITINFPATWFVDTNYKHLAVLAIDKKSSDTLFSPTIDITCSQIPDTNIDFHQIVIANKKDLANSYKEINFEKEKEVTLNGKRAYELPYSVNAANRDLGVFSAYIRSGNYSYNITCIADAKEFNKYRDLFEEVINSAKVTSPQAN